MPHHKKKKQLIKGHTHHHKHSQKKVSTGQTPKAPQQGPSLFQTVLNKAKDAATGVATFMDNTLSKTAQFFIGKASKKIKLLPLNIKLMSLSTKIRVLDGYEMLQEKIKKKLTDPRRQKAAVVAEKIEGCRKKLPCSPG